MKKANKIMIFILCFVFIINIQNVKAFTVSGLGDSRSILNSASLNPVRVGDEVVDKYIDSVLNQITNNNMDTYEKVKACYDYLVKNITYGSGGYFPYDIKKNFQSEYDVRVLSEGIQTLYGKSGTCDGYSGAFVLLTRAIGLNSYVVTGNTKTSSGGWTGHAWVNIYIDGVYYVFDPQVENSISHGNNINYYCFCKTDSQVSGNYQYTNRSKDVYDFKNFSEANGWQDEKRYLYTANGGTEIEHRWYYYINGVKQKGWVDYKSNKYYLNSKNGLMVTGVCKIGSEFYRFDSNGALISKLDSSEVIDNRMKYSEYEEI